METKKEIGQLVQKLKQVHTETSLSASHLAAQLCQDQVSSEMPGPPACRKWWKK